MDVANQGGCLDAGRRVEPGQPCDLVIVAIMALPLIHEGGAENHTHIYGQKNI